jgi:hypothetical protein
MGDKKALFFPNEQKINEKQIDKKLISKRLINKIRNNFRNNY